MRVKVKRVRPGAKLPQLGSSFAAGADLCACIDYDLISIAAHQTVKIPTGVAVEIPIGNFGAVFARSGISTKSGLRPANCVGVVDADYRGEIFVALHNDTDLNQVVENGERIAQLVILPCERAEYEEVDQLSKTERGEDGFGSTGKIGMKKKHRKEIELDDEFWSV